MDAIDRRERQYCAALIRQARSNILPTGKLGVTLAIVATGLGGCALRGAPSYSLFGAFFPAWLLCSALGLVTAFVFRGLVIATGLEEAMPLKLLTYTAFGAAVALWTWLTLFRNG